MTSINDLYRCLLDSNSNDFPLDIFSGREKVIYPSMLKNNHDVYLVIDGLYLVREIDTDNLHQVFQSTYFNWAPDKKDQYEIITELFLVELREDILQGVETFLVTDVDYESNKEEYVLIETLMLYTTLDAPKLVQTMSMVEWLSMYCGESHHIDYLSIHYVVTRRNKWT